MKIIEVVAAIIKENNHYLCVQRNVSKYAYISEKYEFPGGKVEPGETQENALRREIQEELNLRISNLEFFTTISYKYPDFKITMHCYLCTAEHYDLILKEHIAYKWLSKQDLKNLDWAAADVPVVNKLIEQLI
jgi:8-oxo-dGTP diphosphatase